LKVADRVIKKGTISLKDFVCLTEEELIAFFDPAVQAKILANKFRELNLVDKVNGYWAKRSVKKALEAIEKYEKDKGSDKLNQAVLTIQKNAAAVPTIISLIRLYLQIHAL